MKKIHGSSVFWSQYPDAATPAGMAALFFAATTAQGGFACGA